MNLLPLILCIAIFVGFSSCNLELRRKANIDVEKVNPYCVFGVEYESTLNTNGSTSDNLRLTLAPDSTYLIEIQSEMIITNFSTSYAGIYRVNHRGLVTLHGEHPFKKSTIQIGELRTFFYRMNDQLHPSYPKRYFAYCEYDIIDLEVCSK